MNAVLHYIVPTIHILSCLFLIVVVLLQTGKGADMGAVFGGGSQTLFGSGGAGNFLTRLTTATAIIFMLTALILTYGQSPSTRSRLLDKLPSPGAEEPVTPPPAGEAPQPPAAEGGAPTEPPVANAPEAGAGAGEATPPAPSETPPAAKPEEAPAPAPTPEQK